MGLFDIFKDKSYKKNSNNNCYIIYSLNYDDIEKWLNNIFSEKLPKNIIAFNFNLYEDEDNKWSIELIGSDTYDENNEDWACREIFTSRNNLFVFSRNDEWKNILNDVKVIISKYLKDGKCNAILKSAKAIGIGFVDGDIDIIYKER